MNCTFDGSNVYFTSDTRFYHTNIIKYCNRPFKDVEEMIETLTSNWNGTVVRNDVIFYLGDFCFGSPEEWNKILDRLIGQ